MRLPFNIEIRWQDVATIVNLLFGTLAILFLVEAYRQNTSIAAAFILICVLADGADGILARTRGQESLGFQLDSLADLISFGLLPSILVYYVVRETTGNRSIFFLIFIISFIYTVSGMLRLARYNIAPQETTFYGLPITAGGLIIALYILAGLPPAGLLIVALILAGLMISEIKYTSRCRRITNPYSHPLRDWNKLFDCCSPPSAAFNCLCNKSTVSGVS
jgi:CDP-diacylglycerol--serine O-phosphatidyltransferase